MERSDTTVIVTDVKYRMSLAAIRDLGEAGYRVAAFHEAGELPPLGFSSRFVSERRAVPAAGDAAYTSALFSFAEALKNPVIFPVGARTLNLLSLCGEKPGGPAWLASPPEALRRAGDKAEVLKAAASLGIPVPETYADPVEAAASGRYPQVVKYRNGEKLGLSAKDRYRIISSAAECAAVWEAMAAEQPDPLIQEYLPGGGFGVSLLLDRRGRPVSIICHRRIREYPVEGGPSCCCESAWDQAAVDQAVTLCQALGLRGIAMVEFKAAADGTLKLMEINPRVWGTFPLTRAARSGFSEAYVRAALGETLPVCTEPGYRPGRRMNFFFQEAAAAAAYLKRRELKKALGAVGAVLNPAVRDGVFELRDLRASAAYVKSVLRKRA